MYIYVDIFEEMKIKENSINEVKNGDEVLYKSYIR